MNRIRIIALLCGGVWPVVGLRNQELAKLQFQRRGVGQAVLGERPGVRPAESVFEFEETRLTSREPLTKKFSR